MTLIRLALPASLLVSCNSASGEGDSSAPPLAPPVGSSAGWLEIVKSNIAASARAIVPEGDEWVAAIPAHNAVARFTQEGLVLGELDAEDPLHLRFSSWGAPGMEREVEPVSPALGACLTEVLPGGSCARQLEYAHEGVTAWWVGLDQGVEFGWTVATPPVGVEGELVFSMEVEGADWLEAVGEGAELVDASGVTWTISGALAWGADGEPLPAWLEVDGDDLLVRVDAWGAVYPVTVDPVLSAATTTLTAATAGDSFGASVAGVGDVNGDGYDDVIVGAPQFDSGSLTGAGAAYIHHGSSSGVSSTASRTLTGAAAGDEFGFAVAGAGDVNGDGYGDIIIGAYNYDSGSLVGAGRAYIHHGSSSGVSATAAMTLTGGTLGEAFGRSVSGAGDVNNDGYDDVVVGAPWFTNGPFLNAGAVYIHHGSFGGVSLTASSSFAGSAPSSLLGWSVSSAGDVNGDGYADIIIGAPGDDNGSIGEAGRAFIQHGSPSGVLSSASRTLAGGAELDYLGISVSGAGDVNGDGYDDVIVGALRFSSGYLSESVRAYIHHGSSSGVSATVAQTLAGGVARDQLGVSVSGAGDVNSDGYDDVILGAPYTTSGSLIYSGAARVHHGSPSGVSASANATITGGASFDYLGVSTGNAGDVNGDGYDDIIVGASGYDSGAHTDAGAAMLHHGFADADGDGVYVGGDTSTPQDCDDGDNTVGAPSTWYVDNDGDGFGGTAIVTACPGTSGTVATATDCDDTRDDVNPAATERCDAANADEDCDGFADDADPSVDVSSFRTFYADADTDGFGDSAAQMSGCEQPDGYVSDDTDCADEREDVHPGASEICDTEGVDEDCDGLVDDADPSVDASTTLTWYVDEDADGHGAFGSDVDACEAPDGHVAVDDDCDDTRSDVNPDVAEVPDDGVDQDCDGADATTGGSDGGSDGADGGSDGADGTDGADGGGDGSDGGGDGSDGGSDGADGADGGSDGGGSGDVDDEEDDSKGGCACTSASTAPRAWLVGALVVPALIISRRRRNERG